MHTHMRHERTHQSASIRQLVHALDQPLPVRLVAHKHRTAVGLRGISYKSISVCLVIVSRQLVGVHHI